MMTRLLAWLVGSDLGCVANWTPSRAAHYERETWRYLGLRETAFTWSQQYRS